MSPEERQFHEFMKYERDKFIKSKGEIGTHKDEWLEYISKLFRDDVKKFPLVPMVYQSARRAWEENPPWDRKEDDETLFAVAGVQWGTTVTITDPSVPSGYRKIATDQATLEQAREEAILVMTKGAQTSSRGEKKFQAIEKARREAGGDMTRKLYEFRDRSSPKKPPSGPSAPPPIHPTI